MERSSFRSAARVRVRARCRQQRRGHRPSCAPSAHGVPSRKLPTNRSAWVAKRLAAGGDRHPNLGFGFVRRLSTESSRPLDRVHTSFIHASQTCGRSLHTLLVLEREASCESRWSQDSDSTNKDCVTPATASTKRRIPCGRKGATHNNRKSANRPGDQTLPTPRPRRVPFSVTFSSRSTLYPYG
jgi:hypothetical protein